MLTNRKDIGFTEEFDLKIVNGDFVIEQSDQQHVQTIFLTAPGENDEFPTIGFSARKYLKTTAAKKYEILKKLQEQLELDGYDPDFENDIENLIIKV